jgi:hypothetical protein
MPQTSGKARRNWLMVKAAGIVGYAIPFVVCAYLFGF